MRSPVATTTIRVDALGDGHWWAARGKRRHDGVDFAAHVGDTVFAPFSGRVVREARPYKKGKLSGVLLHGAHCRAKLFYLKPDKGLVGKYVLEGQPIGTVQDLSKRHGPQMQPHIHMRIVSIDPGWLIRMLA